MIVNEALMSAEIKDQGKHPEFGQWTGITLWGVQMTAGNQGKHITS
jgi:hypothetical protein